MARTFSRSRSVIAVQTPLNASASSAGALISNSTFEIPQFQREYSWGLDEILDFWTDLKNNIDSNSYFLGLVILTVENDSIDADDESGRKLVVDGQQRLITLTLLATALYYEAKARGREALADRIKADFLYYIDYESDEIEPRVRLSDKSDNTTLQKILKENKISSIPDPDSVSRRISESYDYIRRWLYEDLKPDPFKRLGRWTDFITNRLYFAVFVHPDASSAYQVYEVINTRGKELTTADLLKNYVLSQAPSRQRSDVYAGWQNMARQFVDEGTNNFVQYIRHLVTVRAGHVLPKDLFGFLANRLSFSGKSPPTPTELVDQLRASLPFYSQMMDPSLAGPAEVGALQVFGALNTLNVISGQGRFWLLLGSGLITNS